MDNSSRVLSKMLYHSLCLLWLIVEMGNPFLEKGQDFLVLDTKNIMNISVGEAVRKSEALGEEQYNKFVEERLVKCEKPITDIYFAKTSCHISVVHQ